MKHLYVKVTNTAFNIKIREVENKMSYVNRLITNAAFNKKTGKFQNKISDVSALVPNNAFNTKIGEVAKKFLVMLKILPLLKLINFLV